LLDSLLQEVKYLKKNDPPMMKYSMVEGKNLHFQQNKKRNYDCAEILPRICGSHCHIC